MEEEEVWSTDSRDYELLGIVGRVGIAETYNSDRERLQKCIKDEIPSTITHLLYSLCLTYS